MNVYLTLVYERPVNHISPCPELGPVFEDLDVAKKYVVDRVNEFGSDDDNRALSSPSWGSDECCGRIYCHGERVLGRIYCRGVVARRPVRYVLPMVMSNPVRVYHRLASILDPSKLIRT